MAKIIKGVDKESNYFFNKMSKLDPKLKSDIEKTKKSTTKKTVKKPKK